MRTQFSKLVLSAAFGLAMAFTFSCSSDDKNDDKTPSGSPSTGDPNIDGGSRPHMTGQINNWVSFAAGAREYNISLTSSIEDKISGQTILPSSSSSDVSGSTPSSSSSDQIEYPVPYPENARMFDSNGDGIGDSLVIAYSRGFDPDTLPSMIEVQWSRDTTVLYGIRQTTGGYGKPDNAANLDYWAPYICNGGCMSGRFLTVAELSARRSLYGEAKKELRDTIILYRGPNGENSVRFSKKVLID